MSASRIQFTFVPGDPDRQGIQRIVLAASGPEPVREPEEVLLVDRVQHRDRRPLDDLILQSGDRQRPLSSVRLRYVRPAGRLGPVRSSVDPFVQILEPVLEICLVVPPCQPIHAGSGVALERVERRPEQIDADMVEERGELFLLPLPCDLPYAIQRLGHACPVLCPARALLVRVPLGPRPWLHRLRRRSPGFVRRLRTLLWRGLTSRIVHHRLRLLAFPMRTGSRAGGLWPIARSPGSRARSVRTCQGLRPRRAGRALAITRPSVLPSAVSNDVGTRDQNFRGSMAGLHASPADASPTPSRMPAHGSGPMWFATPSS